MPTSLNYLSERWCGIRQVLISLVRRRAIIEPCGFSYLHMRRLGKNDSSSTKPQTISRVNKIVLQFRCNAVKGIILAAGCLTFDSAFVTPLTHARRVPQVEPAERLLA
jgi:hypothetical protein